MSKVFRINNDEALKKVRFREFGSNGELIDDGLEIVQEGFRETRPAAVAGNPPPALQENQRQPVGPPADFEKKVEAAYLQGKEAGREEAIEHFEKTLEMFAQGIEEISRLRRTLLQNSTHDMLRLVLSISRQVIHAEISINREVILTTVSKALSAAVRSDSYRIKVNPEELELVNEKKPLFMASINGLKNIIFEGDPLIERGGCLVESEFGEVDATIEGQLDEIRRTLLGVMEQ
ncbi:MAG: flagellar assembly protein FliH [Syntrophotaleaceae bacterium]